MTFEDEFRKRAADAKEWTTDFRAGQFNVVCGNCGAGKEHLPPEFYGLVQDDEFVAENGDAIADEIAAARKLHHFLWEEKETTEPPEGLISKDCVACESSADYEREEELTMALGEALARLDGEQG